MAVLVADYGSDSQSDDAQEFNYDIKNSPGDKSYLITNNSEEDDDNTSKSVTACNSQEIQDKLPNPLAKKKKKSNVTKLLTQSVFVNPFEQAKLEKDSVLEKHVKMTETIVTKPKKVCFKFKKGKCHFGKKCTFSHDIEGMKPTVEFSKVANRRHKLSEDVDIKDDDSYMSNVKRKRRAGVNDVLVPPKRAMESLSQQRLKERPWTVTQENKF